MREAFGPKLAPSHEGGGWVWGTRPLHLRPVHTEPARSRRG
jgi:hypothetical protein